MVHGWRKASIASARERKVWEMKRDLHKCEWIGFTGGGGGGGVEPKILSCFAIASIKQGTYLSVDLDTERQCIWEDYTNKKDCCL